MTLISETIHVWRNRPLSCGAGSGVVRKTRERKGNEDKTTTTAVPKKQNSDEEGKNKYEEKKRRVKGKGEASVKNNVSGFTSADSIA